MDGLLCSNLAKGQLRQFEVSKGLKKKAKIKESLKVGKKKSVDVHSAFLEARQGVELLEEQEAKDGHEQPVLCQGEAWMDGAQLASRQQALLRAHVSQGGRKWDITCDFA